MAIATAKPSPQPISQPVTTDFTTVWLKSRSSTALCSISASTILAGAGKITRGTPSAVTSSCQKNNTHKPAISAASHSSLRLPSNWALRCTDTTARNASAIAPSQKPAAPTASPRAGGSSNQSPPAIRLPTASAKEATRPELFKARKLHKTIKSSAIAPKMLLRHTGRLWGRLCCRAAVTASSTPVASASTSGGSAMPKNSDSSTNAKANNASKLPGTAVLGEPAEVAIMLFSGYAKPSAPPT